MTYSALTPSFARTLKELALWTLPEREGALSNARGALNEVVGSLNVLDDLRHSARGIISLYNQFPILDAIDIEIAYSFNKDCGRPYREHRFCFLNTRVLPGRLDPDVTVSEFQEQLQSALEGAGFDPDSRTFAKFERETTLFSEDLACLFKAVDGLDGDVPDEAITLHTTREAIVRALDESGVDAVAMALFPQQWGRMAEALWNVQSGAAPQQAPSRPRP